MKRAYALVAFCALAACRQDMHDQPRYEPLEASTFFADGRASRGLVPGTIAVGQLRDDTHLHAGKTGAGFATEFPAPVTHDVLLRGKERFNVYCSPCHDRAGGGLGMIVRRGFRRPPSLHEERLRKAEPGYLFDVITKGFGVMQPYANELTAEDRWAVVAYLRALQRSQNATLAEVPDEERAKLEGKPKGTDG